MSNNNDKKVEFQFDLDEPFNYAYKGEQRSATFIILKAPSTRNRSFQADLKQAFYRAIPKDESSREDYEGALDKDSKDELTGEQIMAMISMSRDVSLNNVMIIATELFISGVALVDGEEKLTKPLVNEMGFDDLERMTGEYMATFILASLLKSQKRG